MTIFHNPTMSAATVDTMLAQLSANPLHITKLKSGVKDNIESDTDMNKQVTGRAFFSPRYELRCVACVCVANIVLFALTAVYRTF